MTKPLQMIRSQDHDHFMRDGENEETISLQDIPSQKEETDNPTDDETPLLSSSSCEVSTLIEDEYSNTMGNGELKKPGEGGTLFSSFLNMANSIIGAGIIGLPYSFKEAGLFTGIILLIVLTVAVDWTIRLLVINSKLSGRNSYQDMMHFCFGKKGHIAISLFQFAFAFGGMCAFCVIIGDTIPNVIKAIFPTITNIPVLYLFANRNFVIMFCTIFISYPLALYRDITNLAKASGLALISMVIIVSSVAIEGPLVDESLKGTREGTFTFIRSEVFQSIGVISFAFVCHHNSLLIFDALHKPTLNRFAAVTHLSTGISMIACMIMAMIGYLVFTNKTQGNILNNFPDDDFIINIARFCFGFNMFTTLPLESFVCREVINNCFFSHDPFSLVRHVIITSSLVGSAMFISLLTSDLGVVLEITGGFSATALAYILPPLCFLKLSSGELLSLKKLPAICCVAFGICVMILSTSLSIVNLIK